MRLASLSTLSLVAGLGLVGCFGGDADEDDDDGDGSGITPPGMGGGGGGGGGPDPSSDDDGDGYTFAEEEAAGTNPDYAYSHPYTGDYNVGNCEDGVAEGDAGASGSAYAVGDIAANFSLMDQHGEMVDLYSFCGKTVMLVSGAFW